MAELLVRIIDKTSPDRDKDAQLTKRGDVIVVCPDGQPWGREERNNPHWRIVKVPGVDVEDLDYLTAEEIPPDLTGQHRTQRRAVRLSLAALGVDDDPSRRRDGPAKTRAEIVAATRVKPPLPQDAIGPASNVIGPR